jgi:hypothetical protein
MKHNDVCMCLLCSKYVTNVLGQLLDDYDIRLRPDFGGIFKWIICSDNNQIMMMMTLKILQNLSKKKTKKRKYVWKLLMWSMKKCEGWDDDERKELQMEAWSSDPSSRAFHESQSTDVFFFHGNRKESNSFYSIHLLFSSSTIHFLFFNGSIRTDGFNRLTRLIILPQSILESPPL